MVSVTFESQPVGAISHVDGLDTSLVLHLPLTEGEGEIAHNASLLGSVNDGVIHGAMWGEIGLEFNGVDNYIGCSNNASLNFTDAITVEAWIYPITWGGGDPMLGDFEGKIVDKKGAYSLCIYCNSMMPPDSGLCFQSIDSGIKQTSNNYAVLLNTWQQVIVTYDRQDVKFYVNGEYKGGNSETTALNINTDNITIGNELYPPGPTPPLPAFNGTIGEIKIHNRILSVSEAINSFETGRGRYGV